MDSQVRNAFCGLYLFPSERRGAFGVAGISLEGVNAPRHIGNIKLLLPEAAP
jgi:hypothetical protein